MNRLDNTLRSLKFSFRVIFHPFDGFWDLKHEKRGSIEAALAILLMLVLTYILRTKLSGFIVSGYKIDSVNIIFQITSIIAPFIIWSLANWSITTLMDGKGTLIDIIITTSYALVPLVILNVPILIISNIVTTEEIAIYTLLNSVAFLWSGFLLFFGIMTVHQFSVKKTIITIILAIIGMIVIVSIALIFFALIQQMIAFFTIVYKEIFVRNIV